MTFGTAACQEEIGLDPQLVHALDHHTDVVAEDFAEHFVDLGHWRLCSDRRTELRFDHREGAFNITPLVVMGQELATVEIVVSQHVIPETVNLVAVTVASGVALEGNIGLGPYSVNDMQVADA